MTLPGSATAGTAQQASGTGIVSGDTVTVEYTGVLDNGEEFDSGDLEFEVGAGQMIEGFEEGVLGMQEGEEKTFTIPPEKAYGPKDPAKTQVVSLLRTINKTIEVTPDQFEQVIGEVPVEGETFSTETMTWPVKVLSVSSETVIIEYLVEEGDTMDYDYGFETAHIEGDVIEMTLTPTVGAEIMTLYGPLKIVSADEESMTIDFNQPLAGESLTFTVKVLNVSKPAAASSVSTVADGDVCPQLGLTKSARPNVELFIMSLCPYGLQMQKAFLPAMDLLGDYADFDVKWVSYIMHGKPEIDENNVQECIQREYPDKYTSYATCYTTTGETDNCVTLKGIDKTVIDACIADLDSEFGITSLYDDKSTWSGGRYPQYPVHAAENAQYGVQGSPTLVINGKVVRVNRSPEDVKQAVCCAFTNPPAECNQILSAVPASPGIGGGTGSDSSASCG
ncbi:MAG: FKBP-type peptidyl-prolyl cis-trans isomerase [Candidatus Aenigmatarchaeota archaeon]|nr:MAG: FKBP-type peptidyl-prolyl cis-trans isomerase [Candidatus Aenigmarchaeota archaeon]